MSMLRNVTIAALMAGVCLSAASASAQNYAPPVVGYVQGANGQPIYYNRVVVQQDPLVNPGRPYPYMSNAQPVIVQVPPPPYAPRGVHRKAKTKFNTKPVSRELVEELKRRPRIKKVTIEDDVATQSIPPAAPALPPRGKKSSEIRIIRAEAEVKIIGKDQMSIRLFRKGSSPQASAE